jgi:hypothetical protein
MLQTIALSLANKQRRTFWRSTNEARTADWRFAEARLIGQPGKVEDCVVARFVSL